MRWESNKRNSHGKGKKAFPAFPIILGLILIGLLFPIRWLTARDSQTQQLLQSWQMQTRDTFTVSYTHSVELTEVKEIYRIIDQEINLTETVFASYGAGLPATTDKPFEITDQGFRIYDINQLIDPLVYRTGAVRANHQLMIGNQTYPFLEFSLPAEGVQFSITRQPVIYYLIKEVFHD